MATFLSTSRYTNTTVDVDGKAVPVAVRKAQYETQYTTYTAKEGDAFESIACDVFGDPNRYWEIAAINPHVPYPDYIEPGTSIRLPRS